MNKIMNLLRNNKEIIILSFFLAIFLFLLYIFQGYNSRYINTRETYFVDVPAIEEGKIENGILIRFYLSVEKGNGSIYFRIPPIFTGNYITTFLIAKQAVCRILENCSMYNYYIESNTTSILSGFSGTAAFALLFTQPLLGKPYVNYPITGFLLPNGIIAPVGGVSEKLNATLDNNYPYMVAPYIDKHIISAYTLLQVMKIFYNFSFEIKDFRKEIELYRKYMKNIADNLCNKVPSNIYLDAYNSHLYYAAASLCFNYSINHPPSNINMTEYNYIKNYINNTLSNIECKNYVCEEIYTQVLSRYKEALSSNNISYSYYRLLSAYYWLYLMNISNDIKRKDTCSYIDEEFIISEYMIEKTINKNFSCFEKRNYLSNFYYSLIAPDSNYLNNESFSQIKELIYYYYTKYGFSPTSYAYLEYADYLYNIGDKQLALYFLLESLVYAS